MKTNVFKLIFLSFILGGSWSISAETLSQFDQKANKILDDKFEVPNAVQTIDNAKKIIQEIKSAPPFVNMKKNEVWSLKEQSVEFENEITLPDFGFSWLSHVISFIVMFIEVLLWLFPLLVVFFLYRYRAYWLGLIKPAQHKSSHSVLPETLFGLDIAENTLPDDIESTLNQLWLNKKYREAMSLLYRSVLIALFSQYKFNLPPGATENDCLIQLVDLLQSNKVKPIEVADSLVLDEKIKQFKLLTDTWVKVAYAHQFPDDTDFNRLCLYWKPSFLGIKKDEV